jgi:hypothetical protein
MDALLLGHGGQRPVKGHRRRHTFGLQASLYYKQRLQQLFFPGANRVGVNQAE